MVQDSTIMLQKGGTLIQPAQHEGDGRDCQSLAMAVFRPDKLTTSGGEGKREIGPASRR